jgi:hypothetical protein
MVEKNKLHHVIYNNDEEFNMTSNSLQKNLILLAEIFEGFKPSILYWMLMTAKNIIGGGF